VISLGLDISTNCTGYALINENEELESYGYIDTSISNDLYEKIEIFENSIAKHIAKRPDVIMIEDILSKFTKGRSSIKIIIALAKFNALASYKCYELSGNQPIHLNVLRSRNLALGHSVPRGVNSKEHILKYIIEKYPHIELPRMKKKDALAKQAYDICDAVIMSLAGFKHVEHSETTEKSTGRAGT